MTWTTEEKQILEALNKIMAACSFSGESGPSVCF